MSDYKAIKMDDSGWLKEAESNKSKKFHVIE